MFELLAKMGWVTLGAPSSKTDSLTPFFSRSGKDFGCGMYLPNLGKIVFPRRENSGVKFGNPKILEKFPKNWGRGSGPPVLEVKLSRWPYIAPYWNCPPITLGGGDMAGLTVWTLVQISLKLGVPTPKFNIFRKPVGRATSPENFVGQSSETKKLKFLKH